jgi:hypothetical protein
MNRQRRRKDEHWAGQTEGRGGNKTRDGHESCALEAALAQGQCALERQRALGAGAEAGRPGGGAVCTAGPPFSYTVASSAVASRSYRITSVSSCSVACSESSVVWRITIFSLGTAARGQAVQLAAWIRAQRLTFPTVRSCG